MTIAQPALLLLGTLTRRFPQNSSADDGLGCHLVNFASAVFSLEHSLIRQGCVRVKLRRHGIMNEFAFNGDFMMDGLDRKPLDPRRNGAAPTTSTSAIQVSDEFTSRAARGQE